jgi:hypothetical protein
MALTVDSAFLEFNKDIVNLDSEKTKKARNSRDWLIKQLNSLPSKLDDFPILYEARHIKFGSFARNTKIRPLDDIDLLLVFNASGGTHNESFLEKNTHTIDIPEDSKNLRKLCNDDGTLNSIKVVNKIVSSLNKIEHYKNAIKHRRQEAATLSLSSYEWNFDIVPSFYATDDFYLIPDGNGKWKKTDPRIDQSNVTVINQKHNGQVLQLIRTLKYWQKRQNMPTISSYLFEVIVLTYFNSKYTIENFIDLNIRDFWSYLENGIYNSFPDPKGFQGELNNLDDETKNKISLIAVQSYNKACDAINYEINDKDMKKSINKWKEIFGSSFPDYC